MIREPRGIRWIPFSVALFQLALVAWVPVADAVHHCGDHPVTASGESGGDHGDASGLAPVCFICAAGLGAFTSSTPDPTPVSLIEATPTFEAPHETLPPSLPHSVNRARAPPIA